MGDEEQDIDEEGKEGDEQGRQEEDQQGQEVAGGMRRGMEVRRGGETETDESEKSSDGVNDEDGGQRPPSTGGEIEVIAFGVGDVVLFR